MVKMLLGKNRVQPANSFPAKCYFSGHGGGELVAVPIFPEQRLRGQRIRFAGRWPRGRRCLGDHGSVSWREKRVNTATLWSHYKEAVDQ